MKIAYVYDSAVTAPWLAMKYAVALSKNGADVKLFEIKPRKKRQVHGLFDGSLPVQHLIISPKSKWWDGRFQSYLWRRSKIPSILLALLAEKPDCYIAGDPRALQITGIVSRIARARLVYIPFEYYAGLNHDSPATIKKFTRIERVFAHMVSAWVALGDKLADEYRRAYKLGDRVHVVYSSWPAEPKLPKPLLREKLGLGPDQCIVLYQGRISVKRGLLKVVSALQKLPDNVIFVILGYGPDVDLIRRKAAEVRVLDRLRIMDAVSQTELIAYTCDADIGILPILNVCQSYYFCNPGKIFEYMAGGLPIAASNLAQLEWWVRTRDLGVVFDPENPDDIACSLRRLIEDDEFRANCAANSRRIHLTETCWEIQSKRLCAVVFGNSRDSQGRNGR